MADKLHQINSLILTISGILYIMILRTGKVSLLLLIFPLVSLFGGIFFMNFSNASQNKKQKENYYVFMKIYLLGRNVNINSLILFCSSLIQLVIIYILGYESKIHPQMIPIYGSYLFLSIILTHIFSFYFLSSKLLKNATLTLLPNKIEQETNGDYFSDSDYDSDSDPHVDGKAGGGEEGDENDEEMYDDGFSSSINRDNMNLIDLDPNLLYDSSLQLDKYSSFIEANNKNKKPNKQKILDIQKGKPIFGMSNEKIRKILIITGILTFIQIILIIQTTIGNEGEILTETFPAVYLYLPGNPSEYIFESNPSLTTNTLIYILPFIMPICVIYVIKIIFNQFKGVFLILLKKIQQKDGNISKSQIMTNKILLDYFLDKN